MTDGFVIEGHQSKNLINHDFLWQVDDLDVVGRGIILKDNVCIGKRLRHGESGSVPRTGLKKNCGVAGNLDDSNLLCHGSALGIEPGNRRRYGEKNIVIEEYQELWRVKVPFHLSEAFGSLVHPEETDLRVQLVSEDGQLFPVIEKSPYAGSRVTRIEPGDVDTCS